MLTVPQKRQASSYAPGFPIATIAQQIGASFEEVAVYLYGDGADWSPPRLRQDQERNDEADASNTSSGDHGADAGRSGSDRGPAATEPAADESGAAASTAATEETAPPAIAEAEPSATAAPSAERFRLTNGAGDYLHKSGVGMTRDLEKAWAGTPEQLLEVRRRRPHLDVLEQEPVA